MGIPQQVAVAMFHSAMMICNPFQDIVVIYRARWLQIIAEANLKFHFREYENIFALCKMLELNFGRALPTGLLYCLILLLPQSQRSQNKSLASWSIFP